MLAERAASGGCATEVRCREVAQQAQTAFGAGNFSQALALYQEAFGGLKEPQFLLWIGRAHQKLCALEEARRSFARFRAEDPAPLPEFSQRLAKYEAELENPAPPCEKKNDIAQAPKGETKTSNLAQPTPAGGKESAAKPRSKAWIIGLVGGVAAACALGIGLGVGLGANSSSGSSSPMLIVVPLER